MSRLETMAEAHAALLRKAQREADKTRRVHCVVLKKGRLESLPEHHVTKKMTVVAWVLPDPQF